MYRTGEEYNSIERMVAEVYCDYGFCKLPIDAEEVCAKMGIQLVPLPLGIRGTRKADIDQYPYGYYVKRTPENPPTIFYDDWITVLPQEQRFTIFHEIKHFVFEDEDDAKDDLADHFSRCFMCPPAYFLLKGISDPEELAKRCNMTFTAASYASRQISNRRNKYGTRLYSYEVDMIQLIEPELLLKVEGKMKE